MQALDQLGDALKLKAGAQQELRAQAAAAQERSERLGQEAAELDEAVAVLAALQEMWRARFEKAVGAVVSQGLQGVFGEGLELVVQMGVQADLPTTKFMVRDDSGLTTDVMEARGGGLVNVASFLLRVLTLLAARPALARLLVLDESFNNVSEEYLPALTALLRRICEEGGFQIVLVSHRPALADAADVAYAFSLQHGETQVRRLRGPEDEVAEGGPDGALHPE